MSSQIDNRAIKKALNKVNNSEKLNRSLKKRSEDYQVFQDVFNKPTLLTLYSLFNNGTLSYLNGIVNSGKEVPIATKDRPITLSEILNI